jgi:hypothetical protein
MVKRSLRAAIRLAKDWLAEAEIEPQNNCGDPPFSYGDTHSFFKKIIRERRLRRPHYVWGAVQGLNLARMLGMKRVSFVEFGVAGGNGLTALESIAETLGPIFDVDVEIHGFDAVVGMPKATDHRDVPNLFREGFYPMDKEKLELKLKQSKLHLGMIEETLPQFLSTRPAPVAFLAFDFCFYTATSGALRVFDADPCLLMPRVHCFFRNTLGPTEGDFNGERLAITEFNANHEMKKISQVYGLQHYLGQKVGRWVDQYYLTHIFDHPLYGNYDGLVRQETLELQS